MARLTRLAAVLFLAAFALVLTPQAACACSCVAMSDTERVDRADLIFVGVVTAVDEPFSLRGGPVDEVEVTFQVETVSKGETPGRTILGTYSQESSCGYTFAVGYRYEVFANGGKTNLCSGNKLINAAPEVPLESSFPVLPVVIGGVVVIAGVIAFVLYRRRAL